MPHATNTVQDIREYFANELVNQNFVIDKSGVKMIELIGATFIADEDYIFRKLNEDYAKREIEWYQSQSLNVNDIPGEVPAIWKAVATPEGLINSNYGWMVYSHENGLQFHKVLNELLASPFSRRAIMIYNRPSMHEDYNAGGMSDFCCTMGHQYFIRDGKLETHVSMRSCDLIFGFNNDLAWAKHIRDHLLKAYNQAKSAQTVYTGEEHTPVVAGDIVWSVGSAHVYERHFKFVEKFITKAPSVEVTYSPATLEREARFEVKTVDANRQIFYNDFTFALLQDLNLVKGFDPCVELSSIMVRDMVDRGAEFGDIDQIKTCLAEILKEKTKEAIS